MTEWINRPVEIANLFNPAFGAVILYEAVAAYEKEREQGMPYALSFLVFPIVLHNGTRILLPRGTQTKLHVWIQDNLNVKIDFPSRAQRSVEYTKEAILFGLQMNIFEIQHNGNISTKPKMLKRPKWQAGTEPNECAKKAAMIGKWFAISGDASTIFAVWGIHP
ncbi:MAG: hypothetical protein KC423_07705 [Anaerolineales bacterium]|nr:hypothetical protein [Anaerolineales bacterium]